MTARSAVGFLCLALTLGVGVLAAPLGSGTEAQEPT